MFYTALGNQRTRGLAMKFKLWPVACAMVASISLLGCAGLDEEDDEGAPLDEIELAGNRAPVIFVPPCPPPGVDYPTVAGAFVPLMNYLKANKGYTDAILFNWIPNTGLPVCYSSYDLAAALAVKVQEVRAATGATKVDLVGASGGPVTARVYLAQGGHQFVGKYVSIAGVNHGTDFAIIAGDLQDMFGYPNYEQMKELYPPYACQGEAYFGESGDVQFDINGCLTPTGRTVARDETPGTTKYLSIRNLQDDQIFPNQSACLNMRFQNDCADTKVNVAVSVPGGPCDFPAFGNQCPPHVRTIFDVNVHKTVAKFLTD